MCSIFLQFDDPSLQWAIFTLGENGQTGNRIQQSNQQLQEGFYIVLRYSKIWVNRDGVNQDSNLPCLLYRW
jgi:hypothetical protein